MYLGVFRKVRVRIIYYQFNIYQYIIFNTLFFIDLKTATLWVT